MPTLSICIPTRNRQAYVIEVLRWIFKIARVSDFEVIVSDNSDDASLLPMLLQEQNLANQHGLVFLRSPDTGSQVLPLPMNLNFQRCLDRVTGEWLIFIGDDDFVDPNATIFLKRLSDQDSDIDFVWNPLTVYGWPCIRASDEHNGSGVTRISLKSGLRTQDLELLKRRIEAFEGTQSIPVGLPPYHNFLKLSLVHKVQRNLAEAEQRFFFHENTDYFMGYVLTKYAKKPVYCERPLSIQGVCVKSNSHGITRPSSMRAAVQRYKTELAGFKHSASISAPLASYEKLLSSSIDEWQSKTVYVLSLFIDFVKLFNIPVPVQLGEKVRAGLENEYKSFRILEDSDFFRDGANRFIENNFPGIEPIEWNSPESAKVSTGFRGLSSSDLMLYVLTDIGGATSVGQFYSLVDSFLTPPEFIGKPIQIKTINER